MCYFAVTRFPCGCLSSSGSEYKYCSERGGSCKTKTLGRYEWLTFCPEARKAMDAKIYSHRVTYPKCCENMQEEQLNSLCRKCNSIVDNNSENIHPCCSGEHRVLLSTGTGADVEKEFEKAAELWPSNFRSRYLRRKKDKNARNCGWSL
ncbi:hypothetical protein F5Y11DRAFT_340592 [Daldinia sp. FL1419]|nr:hypothetical protein F5Y11DRAFT_340592 [Daldinia sp. FL1419]